MLNFKKYYLLVPLTLMIFFSSQHIVIGQSGFAKTLSFENISRPDIDDIIYKENYLYITGNSFDDNLDLWGTLIAKTDTVGNILWSHVFFDSLKVKHFNTFTPTRFFIGQHNEILMLANDIVLLITDSLGNEIVQKKYVTDDLFTFTVDVRQINKENYIFGFAQRQNHSIDIVVFKTDSVGTLKWRKYYKADNREEVLGGVYLNSNNTFTIAASSSKGGWYTTNEITGSNKPWIFTIDTSGAILHQWYGEENDTRTNGRGPIYRAKNGDYIVASYDIKEFPGTLDPVRASPTITRLDSNFNLVWKHNLTNFTNYWDKIQGMVYDSTRDEFIVAGDQRIYYTPDSIGADAWFEKISGDGEIVWNRSDTAIYLGYAKQEHFTSGIAIAPSGSLYVAGWVYSQENKAQAWIMKVTPDGCSDTLCTITSLQDHLLVEQNDIFIRPNPASDELHLFVPDGFPDAEVHVVNLQGLSVLNQSLGSGENVIELDCPGGIYFYSVWNNGHLLDSGKFVRL